MVYTKWSQSITLTTWILVVRILILSFFISTTFIILYTANALLCLPELPSNQVSWTTRLDWDGKLVSFITLAFSVYLTIQPVMRDLNGKAAVFGSFAFSLASAFWLIVNNLAFSTFLPNCEICSNRLVFPTFWPNLDLLLPLYISFVVRSFGA